MTAKTYIDAWGIEYTFTKAEAHTTFPGCELVEARDNRRVFVVSPDDVIVDVKTTCGHETEFVVRKAAKVAYVRCLSERTKWEGSRPGDLKVAGFQLLEDMTVGQAIAEAKKQLDEAKKQRDASKKQPDEAQKQPDEAQKQLDEAQKQPDEAKKEQGPFRMLFVHWSVSGENHVKVVKVMTKDGKVNEREVNTKEKVTAKEMDFFEFDGRKWNEDQRLDTLDMDNDELVPLPAVDPELDDVVNRFCYCVLKVHHEVIDRCLPAFAYFFDKAKVEWV